MYGMTTKETAEKWGISLRQVQLLCANGRIPGAIRFGHVWVVPVDAEKPQDRRIRATGNNIERSGSGHK